MSWARRFDEIARESLMDGMAAAIGERFSLSRMSRAVLHGYRNAMRIAARHQPAPARTPPRHI